MSNNSFEWIPLDCAAKVFPGQNTNRWSNVFRLSIQLKEQIDPEILKLALNKTFERIPCFKVRIRNGFFWNYYELNEAECPINHDIKNHCYRIDFKENNGYLFRIYYHGCRISVDIYHALCDGHGGAVFLSTLAGEYLRLKGNRISHNQFVLNVNSKPKAEEQEDAYRRYATSDQKSTIADTFAYHKKGTGLPLHMCNYTAAIMSFDELHALSKSYGVTVTELFAAILLDIHYKKQLNDGKSRKNVTVQIPVNLRKFFHSETLRNFVLCVTVKIDPRKGEYTFDEIVKSVSSQLKNINNAELHHAYITKTVRLGTESIKLFPLVLKNLIVKTGFSFGAEYSTSVLISNLGAVTVPEDMKQHVERFFFYTGPGLVNGARCGVVSFGDSLAFTFSNRYEENDIEKEFLKRLAAMGMSVTVETNRSTDFSDVENIICGDRNAYSDEVIIPSKKSRKTKFKNQDISFSKRLERFFHL